MNSPTDEQIENYRRALARLDPLLAKADAVVPPISWRIREHGFGGLVHQIVGQQVSIAAAAAILKRLTDGLGGLLTPEAVLAAEDAHLRNCGLSGQKVRYVRAVAEAADVFREMHILSDDDAVSRLVAIKGVGRWTAETYLMFSEGRLDFFPAGDLALQEGYRLLSGTTDRPSEKELCARADVWRPHRGVAALMLWGYYALLRSRATEATKTGSAGKTEPPPLILAGKKASKKTAKNASKKSKKVSGKQLKKGTSLDGRESVRVTTAGKKRR